MRILAIELKNCLRLSLNDYRFIRIDFTDKVQQILGTNGSGKSSLLEMLNPLAAHHNDFDKGGYKKIWIEHRGSMYECISDFTSGRKHTFIKDGEILNDAGNATMQNQLVVEHFNYTPELRDLQLGKILFTKLNSNQRRYWFDKLSTVDYSFANKAYQFFRERHRDIRGTLKEFQHRLVSEKAKLINEAEVSKFQNDVNILHEEISVLLEHRENPNIDLDTILGKYKSFDNELQLISTDILRENKYNSFKVNSKEELLSKLEELKLEKTSIESKISLLVKNHTELNDEYQTVKKNADIDINVILEKKNKLLELKSKLNDELKLGICKTDSPNSLFDQIENTILNLDPIISILPLNTDREYSQQNLNILRESRGNLEDNKKQLVSQLQAITAKIKHLEYHKSKGTIKCPQCTHEWILGYDDNDYVKLIELSDQLEDRLKKLDLLLEDKVKSIDEMMEYGTQVRQFQTICDSANLLTEFFIKVKVENLLFQNPKRILFLLHQLKEDALIYIRIQQIDKELEQFNHLEEMSKNVGLKNLNSLEVTLNKLNTDIEQLTVELNLIRHEYQAVESFLTSYITIEGKAKRIEDINISLKELDKLTVKSIKFDLINTQLRQKQSDLSTLEKRLQEIRSIEARVEYIEDQINALTIDYETLEILLKELSPKEGLIAQAMFGFINLFISNINSEIKKVWSYPLEVGLCSIEDDNSLELDYKFPLLVGVSKDYRNDINEGSEGMQEIINLTFILVAMQFLDMKDYPIYLDEFATSFDETHREKAIYLIKSLLENYDFSQLFMVSHYFHMHGAVSNAEVCILNDLNISNENNANTHVTFQ